MKAITIMKKIQEKQYICLNDVYKLNKSLYRENGDGVTLPETVINSK